MDWEMLFRKQGYVFILTDFKPQCFDVSFLTSIFVNYCFETEKVWNKCHKHFVYPACYIWDKTMISDLKVNLETNFVFDLILLNCRLRLFEYFFSKPFPFKEKCFFYSFCFLYLFNASTRLFWIFPFAQSCKILSKFSNLSVILKHRG